MCITVFGHSAPCQNVSSKHDYTGDVIWLNHSAYCRWSYANEDADGFESMQNWIRGFFADQLPAIIDVNPSLGSSLHVDMSAACMHTLHLQHETTEAWNGCKEQCVDQSLTTMKHHETLVSLNNILHIHEDIKYTGKKGYIL